MEHARQNYNYNTRPVTVTRSTVQEFYDQLSGPTKSRTWSTYRSSVNQVKDETDQHLLNGGVCRHCHRCRLVPCLTAQTWLPVT
jgi:hypothetical protein